MSKKGIDVSQYQEIINWEKVKPQIDFAILRLGWIGNYDNHTLDSYFNRNYEECKRLNIPFGIYVYNYCRTVEAVESAIKWIKKIMSNKSIELPIFIDMEDKSIENETKEKLTVICEYFCEEIKKLGFKAGVYANRNWYVNYLNKNRLYNKYTLWIAHYTNETEKYKGEYDIWQNSSKGKIEGIKGNVDTNYLYNIDLLNNTNDKDIEEKAIDVINGRYGNGEERKQKLGNTFQNVQNIVNQILLKNDIENIVNNVINGKYGNGSQRKEKLGVLYQKIQDAVNRKLKNS